MRNFNFSWVDNSYRANSERYQQVAVRRCGTSGLRLPAVSLGLWHNFGDDRPFQTQRDMLRRAFDLGIFHFDLANNYGPPFGAAEENFGRAFAKDFRPYREELVISTKAGWDMWPGAYGFGGSRKYLLNSLDASLQRMGLDYVDIFYHHRPDPDTDIAESMQALHDAIKQGKALYAGISSYSASATREAAEIMRQLGTPLVIHQPAYSMFNRWVEEGEPNLLQTLENENMGSIVFTPLAQGLLTNRYLQGVPANSRLASGKLEAEHLSPQTLKNIQALNDIAHSRGQSLAQMALAWVLRHQVVTSALVGASKVAQIEDCVGAMQNLEFTAQELDLIEQYAQDAGINGWADAIKSRP